MHNQAYLNNARDWLWRAIAYESMGRPDGLVNYALDKACEFELIGLGFKSFKFKERKQVADDSGPSYEYIDFNGMAYRQISAGVH